LEWHEGNIQGHKEMVITFPFRGELSL